MTASTGSTSNPASAATSIIQSLKLSHLVAIIMMGLVTIIDISFIFVKVFTGASLVDLQYPLIVGVVSTAMTMMAYYWSTTVASGSYVSASASMMQVGFTGGQNAYPPTSAVTSSGIIGNNLTASDLAAVNSLITAGKLNPSVLATLSTMTPSQIQAFLQSFGAIVKP